MFLVWFWSSSSSTCVLLGYLWMHLWKHRLGDAQLSICWMLKRSLHCQTHFAVSHPSQDQRTLQHILYTHKHARTHTRTQLKSRQKHSYSSRNIFPKVLHIFIVVESSIIWRLTAPACLWRVLINSPNLSTFKIIHNDSVLSKRLVIVTRCN